MMRARKLVEKINKSYIHNCKKCKKMLCSQLQYYTVEIRTKINILRNTPLLLQITNSAIGSLVSNLPELENLDLRGCKQVK